MLASDVCTIYRHPPFRNFHRQTNTKRSNTNVTDHAGQTEVSNDCQNVLRILAHAMSSSEPSWHHLLNLFSFFNTIPSILPLNTKTLSKAQ